MVLLSARWLMNIVHVIDYGVGNIFNVVRALKHLGFMVELYEHGTQWQDPGCVILPGVGAFGDCMQALEQRSFIDPIKKYVGNGGFLIGICVGMHLLADSGEEFGIHQGLGLVSGTVKHLSTNINARIKVPHIAWSPLLSSTANSILNESYFNQQYYFVHSYKFCVNNREDELAYTEYGGAHVSAIVGHNNVVGVQFHPEKSGEVGLQLFKSLIELSVKKQNLIS